MTKPKVPRARQIAIMGGAYGNVPAREACLADAEQMGCDTLAFICDTIGCCGHSDQIISLIRDQFDILVAGNHEQQAAADKETCGCGYENQEDERISCQAFASALESLIATKRTYLGTWPDRALIRLSIGRLLLCHGSPDRTSEFLYESQVNVRRMNDWLTSYGCTGFACTHTGLPRITRWGDNRFAVNCGVTGKPDHDGDPAVHYAVIDGTMGRPSIDIRRVTYDYQTWVGVLEDRGIDPIFIEPLRTGRWTTGRRSLPDEEREQLRAA